MYRRILCITLIVIAGVLSGSLPARSGGIILYETATSAVGLASAGYAARAQDASTVFTNPAGITRVEDSQLMSSVQALYGSVRFHQDASIGPQHGGNGGNSVGWFPGLSFYATHNVNEKVGLGFATLSYFGLGVDYDNDWVGRYYVQDATLLGLTLMPAISYKINDYLSIGAGLNVMYGVFKQEVAIKNLVSASDGKLKIDTNDWGVGVNLGMLVQLNKRTRIGITYLSKVKLDFEDRPSFENLGPAMSAILSKRGLLGSRINMGMDVPQSVMMGFYHAFNDKFALMGDVGWQDWSDFGKVDISVNSENPKSLTADRHYDDTWHVALGGQYQWSKDLLLSAGVAYDSSMVKDQYRTPDLATGASTRFGLGTQYRLKDNLTLDFGWTFCWMGDLGMNQSSPLKGRLSGTYENAYINFISANLKWIF